MLASSATVAAVARWAAAGKLPNLVVDPVLVASTGRPLLDDGGVDAYLRLLLPHALVRHAQHARGRPAHRRGRRRRRRHGAAPRVAWPRPGVRRRGGEGRAPRRRPRPRRRGPRRCARTSSTARASRSATTTARAARCRPPPPPSWPAASTCSTPLARPRSSCAGALAGSATWHLGAGHGPLDHFGWGSEPDGRLETTRHDRPARRRGATSRSLVAPAPRRRPTGGRVTPQTQHHRRKRRWRCPPGALAGLGVGDTIGPSQIGRQRVS